MKIRYDLKIVAKLVKENSKVLDIGCGDGELLEFLKIHKKVDGRGIEISNKQVSNAIKKGLSVIHGDAEKDLLAYPDQSFEYAILSQSIQTMNHPKEIINEMLRIAKYAIISLPNFAYYKNRLYLLLKGKMPINKIIPYQWYDTPNIHFCSIKDFKILCKELNFITKNEIFINSDQQLNQFILLQKFSNLFAEYGIFLITKKEFKTSDQEEFAFKKDFVLGYKQLTTTAFFKKD
jgi:methionine biosynthesis protein MetW